MNQLTELRLLFSMYNVVSTILTEIIFGRSEIIDRYVIPIFLCDSM